MSEYSVRLVGDSARPYQSTELQGAWPKARLTQLCHGACPQTYGSEVKAIAGWNRTLTDIRMHPYQRRFSDFVPWRELRHSTADCDISHTLGHIKACGIR